MIKICFICHGNICRSPMAEFIMKQKVKELNLENIFYITSKATSTEEIGNDIHYGTKRKLDEHNIPYTRHYASQVKKEDYENFDYFICMDDNNVRNLSYIFDDPSNKVYKLLENDIADPWYTGNFDITYKDVEEGCRKFLEYILKEK